MYKQALSILILFITIISCKNQDSSENEKVVNFTISDKNADKRKLDKKLLKTNQIWDSLNKQLKNEHLDSAEKDSIRSLINQNKYRQEEIFKSFIRNNPNSIVSIEALNGFKFAWGKDTTQKLYNSLISPIKESGKGELVRKYIKFYNSPKVSDIYSDFTLPNVDGDSIKISQKLTDFTLLEFWASWCTGCRRKHPELIKVYEKYQHRDFSIIGISSDSREQDWLEAVKEDNLPWINLRDSNGRESVVQYQYGIHVLPTNFLIGPDKRIIAKDISPEDLELFLNQNLEKPLTTTYISNRPYR